MRREGNVTFSLSLNRCRARAGPSLKAESREAGRARCAPALTGWRRSGPLATSRSRCWGHSYPQPPFPAETPFDAAGIAHCAGDMLSDALVEIRAQTAKILAENRARRASEATQGKTVQAVGGQTQPNGTGVMGDARGDAELEQDDAHALCRGDETLEVQHAPLARSDRRWRDRN
jgi:hypothetical protein